MQLLAAAASIDGVVIESELSDYLKFVYLIACLETKRFRCPWRREVFFQEGCVALLECLKRYDGRVRFKTFLQYRVYGKIKDYLRHEWKSHAMQCWIKQVPIDDYEGSYSVDYPLQYDLEHLRLPKNKRTTAIIISTIITGSNVETGAIFGIDSVTVCNHKRTFRKVNQLLAT